MQIWTEMSRRSTGISWSKSTSRLLENTQLPGKRWRARGCQMTPCWRLTPGIGSWSISYRWVFLQRENILLHNPLINFTFTQSGGQSQIQDDEDLAVTEDEVRPQQNPLLKIWFGTTRYHPLFLLVPTRWLTQTLGAGHWSLTRVWPTSELKVVRGWRGANLLAVGCF